MTKFIVLIIIIIAAGAGGYFIFRSEPPVYELYTVKRGDLVQEVSVTGKVKPAKEVALAFEKSGRVAAMNVKVGDRVFAGQILASLENGEASANLEGAKANLRVQEAKLLEMERGTRPEEIQVQEVMIINAKAALEDAKRNLIDKLRDAYTKSDDAVRNYGDQLFDNPRYSPTLLSIITVDSKLKTDIENSRLVLEKIFPDWLNAVNQLFLEGDLGAPLSAGKQNLLQIKTFLEKIASAVNSLTTNSSLTQTTIDGWKTDVSAARTNMNTAIANLTAAEEKLATAGSDVSLYEEQLVLKKAGSLPEAIAGQTAQVEKAGADIKNYEVQFNKTILFSPIRGIVTKSNAKVGEIIAASVTIIDIISEADFEIEANVPEVDIAKVKIGDKADLTLDAYGEKIIFPAVVSKIDPAETVVESVSTYKTTLQFEQKDERIKSGMTANITIFSSRSDGALYIPQRAVAAKNGGNFVQVFTGGGVEEREVETGLKDSGGNIEIISGLNEGESVVNY